MNQQGYWYLNFGRFRKCSRDFIEGIIAGVEAFAVWKNGRQVVGILEKPLEEVVAEIKEELEAKKAV